MRQLRRRSEPALLALLALVAQLALSFAHTHAPRAPDANLALACRTFFAPRDHETCPPQRTRSDECPVCWATAAAGTLVLSEPPALALPALDHESRVPIAQRSAPHRITTASFDARGPPLPVLI